MQAEGDREREKDTLHYNTIQEEHATKMEDDVATGDEK